MNSIFGKYLEATEVTDPIKCVGHIIGVRGLLIESKGPQAIIGEICRIELSNKKTCLAEVVGLKDETVQLMSYGETGGIEIGCRVIASGNPLEVALSPNLLGRVLDSFGKSVDGKGEIGSSIRRPVLADSPDPYSRPRITERISTGIRSIDSLLAVGRGQRLGIFAGSGVGKSTLLGMIARNTSADVNVVALIGERGREVNEFIENDLGKSGLARSVVVVSPSSAPPLSRLRGAYVATTIAEYFRDMGLDVMLLFDSLTRFARAQREIGLASGEPPATRGYTPSMFDSMPKLLERCGTSEKGTITGFYTILVDGDDLDEPVSDTVRGILDGHVVLSRTLAQRYHYPAIDILGSISRLATTVSGPQTKKAAGVIRRYMADYDAASDLINVGAYRQGSNPRIDAAIAKHDAIEQFLIQAVEERSGIDDTLLAFGEIAGIEIPPDEMMVFLPRMVLPLHSEEEDEDEYYSDTTLEALPSEQPEAQTPRLDAPLPVLPSFESDRPLGTAEALFDSVFENVFESSIESTIESPVETRPAPREISIPSEDAALDILPPDFESSPVAAASSAPSDYFDPFLSDGTELAQLLDPPSESAASSFDVLPAHPAIETAALDIIEEQPEPPPATARVKAPPPAAPLEEIDLPLLDW